MGLQDRCFAAAVLVRPQKQLQQLEILALVESKMPRHHQHQLLKSVILPTLC